MYSKISLILNHLFTRLIETCNSNQEDQISKNKVHSIIIMVVTSSVKWKVKIKYSLQFQFKIISLIVLITTFNQLKKIFNITLSKDKAHFLISIAKILTLQVVLLSTERNQHLWTQNFQHFPEQTLQVKLHLLSISQMVVGFAPNAKTTISREELSAIDAKRPSQSKTTMVNLSTFSRKPLKMMISLEKI